MHVARERSFLISFLYYSVQKYFVTVNCIVKYPNLFTVSVPSAVTVRGADLLFAVFTFFFLFFVFAALVYSPFN